MTLSKKEILEALREQKSQFTKQEVLAAIEKKPTFEQEPESAKEQTSSMTIAAYVFGAVLVLTGILALIYQYWNIIETPIQILITLVLGVICIAATVVFDKHQQNYIAIITATIGAVLTPIGCAIFINEILNKSFSPHMQVFVAALLTIAFLGIYFNKQKASYLFITTVFATWTIYAIVSLEFIRELFGTSRFLFSLTPSIYYYTAIALGVAYIGLGHLCDTKKIYKKLATAYYFVGPWFITLPLFSLAQQRSLIWELVTIIAFVLLLTISIRWSKKSLFIASTATASIYVFILSSRYFANTLGWPISLIIAGIILILAGSGLLKLFRAKQN